MSRPRLETALWSTAGAVGLVVLWEAIVRLLDVRPMVLLAPSEILSTFADESFDLGTLVSGTRIELGLDG